MLFSFCTRVHSGNRKKILWLQLLLWQLFFISCSNNAKEEIYNGLPPNWIHAQSNKLLSDKVYLSKDSTLLFPEIRVDENGGILPWPSADLGASYDQVINAVWTFWNNMELDTGNVKYYLLHQVWKPHHDPRGLGGDQLMMAFSSWDLLYNYTGKKEIIDNMKYMADYYLEHGMSVADAQWANLPFPYNTNIHSGIYDGDMILGKGFLQPDKAGSFGYELIHLYKKTNDPKYLEAAIKIANTLAAKVQQGDESNSPWPFKVNAATGEVGKLFNHRNINPEYAANGMPEVQSSSYTTNWTGTLQLFSELKQMGKGDTTSYDKAYHTALEWMKQYPSKNNKWGPFFEDINGWSDTQINAVTYALFLMDHEEADLDWKNTVQAIFEWVHRSLDNKEFIKYGVTTINEQTAYRVPGNSHSSRQAAAELRYWEKTGDTSGIQNAIRQLNWATYMVDKEGKNYYLRDNYWLTDGYGDYVRHYLRAMAAEPQLAPSNANHLLRTSSIISEISYRANQIRYITFDEKSVEKFRLTKKPVNIIIGEKPLQQSNDKSATGWIWESIGANGGGILYLNKKSGRQVEIIF
ncbi:MAG: hypothetical protein JSS98_10965 [Bacteroidetes bacterium]|nr:hypothetical protein [Bacteroidota bacterium]